MGDPRFITSETAFHVGTCNQDGLFPRLSNQLLTTYDSILQSYCDVGEHIQSRIESDGMFNIVQETHFAVRASIF
jgi:hypothetical protein